jgi:two-component system, LytTR family, response regulator
MREHKLTAIIVDDELDARTNLNCLIKNYCNHINVVGMVSSIAEAATLIDKVRPDVVFLDISMPNGDGFELLKMLKYIPSVVFVTAFEKYAVRAIKAAAVDFLLKPININELVTVQEKLVNLHGLINQPEIIESYRSVIRNFVALMVTKEPIRKIALPDKAGLNVVDVGDIVYLEGRNNYTVFVTSNQKSLTVSKTLKEYEDILSDSGFVRIHKSNIINMQHLKKYSTKNMEAVMSDETKLSISRRRAAEFFTKAKDYVD